MRPARRGQPRIVFLHYSAPPIVGGVEAVIAEQVRLFSEAGFPTLIIAGRKADEMPPETGPVVIIPELDSENPRYLAIVDALKEGKLPPEFAALQAVIESGLEAAVKPDDIVIAHNVMTTHFNLALTSAVHHLLAGHRLPRLIIWCHDISRHVNPDRPEPQYRGAPWDLLRTWLPQATYVAVSTSRQQTLAAIIDCPVDAIRVVPNGVDPLRLLALSPTGQDLAVTYGLYWADLVILMPVRITRVKNIEFALRVVQLLKRSGLLVRLVVTGPPDPHAPDIPDYFQHLLDLREQLSLQEDACFVYEGTAQNPGPLGIDAAVVAELYRLADVILMPSLREGFGIPVLEALLVDRPVFATSIPVTQDLPEFHHLIRKDESPDSVAQRIAEWAKSDSTHHLRSVVRRDYTWSGIFTKRILPLIDGVQRDGPHP